MRFLKGTEIQQQVKRLSDRSGELMAAVAYWGKDGAKLTGLKRKRECRKVRIICDLLSGSCNPSEVEELMALPGVEVKTLDRLHAKVWIGGDEVILGSANASMNGLPDNAKAIINGNIEAAALLKDRSLSHQLKEWFEKQWKKSTKIDGEILIHAKRVWKRRRPSGPRAFTGTTDKLMNKVRKLSEIFPNLRVLAYLNLDYGKEVHPYVQGHWQEHYSREEWPDIENKDPYYEWPPQFPEWADKNGAVVMDFSCDKEHVSFDFNGFWEIRALRPLPSGNHLTFLVERQEFEVCKFTKNEKETLANRVYSLAFEREFYIDEFGCYIDMNFSELWEFELITLKERLISQAVEAAQNRCRTGQFDCHLILNAILDCKNDDAWLRDYETYVGGKSDESGNRLKKQVNQQMGRRIKKGVGGEDLLDDDGRIIRRSVIGEIIQSYTLLKKFDEKAIP